MTMRYDAFFLFFGFNRWIKFRMGFSGRPKLCFTRDLSVKGTETPKYRQVSLSWNQLSVLVNLFYTIASDYTTLCTATGNWLLFLSIVIKTWRNTSTPAMGKLTRVLLRSLFCFFNTFASSWYLIVFFSVTNVSVAARFGLLPFWKCSPQVNSYFHYTDTINENVSSSSQRFKATKPSDQQKWGIKIGWFRLSQSFRHPSPLLFCWGFFSLDVK